MADPMAVRIVVKKEGVVLLKVSREGVHLPVFLCRRMELPQDTAKRVLREVFGLRTERVVSLPIISRIAVEDIPEEERKTWPKGAKTIPCISFSYTVEAGTPVNVPSFEWVGKGDWKKLPDESDRAVLDNLY